MKFRIFKRILLSPENSKLDWITKFYLIQNYTSNLAILKKNNDLTLMNKIFSIKFKNKKFVLPDHVNANLKEKNNINEKSSGNSPNLETELEEIKENLRKKKIKQVLETIYYYLQKINLKHILDLKNSQNNLKHFFNFLSRNIEIYKRSIQELVEGQREVTQNKNFQFEDGETVQDKMDKFELKLKENLNISASIIDSKKNTNKFI